MRLQLVKYTCGVCHFDFEAPALAEGAYGEFLLWSRTGKMAYLNAFADSSLKEVDILLSHNNALKNISALDRSKILHRLYGRVACDPDEEGAPFEINTYPPCPSCGNVTVSSWEFKEPTELVDIDVPVVTHQRWYSLSVFQKNELLEKELCQAGIG